MDEIGETSDELNLGRPTDTEPPRTVDTGRVLGSGNHNLAISGPNGLSVVIPAWNEEKRLPTALDEYLPLLEAFGIPVEVIVVLDGVTDRTAEVAASYRDRGVSVLRFDRRLGKGGAVMAGFRRAKFELVGFLDADAPITAVSLAYLLSELGTHDGAIASRWHERSNRNRKQPFARLISSKAWNVLARAVLGLHVRDTQCGAKFFRRDAVLDVLDSVTLTNWAFDACLLFHFQRAGYRITEVPVNWSDDPNTKLKVDRVAPQMLLSLIGIRLMNSEFLSDSAKNWAGWFHRVLT